MLKKQIRLRAKNQLTLPHSITDHLDLEEGENLEVSIEKGRVVLTPVVTIEKSQAWFWTKEWQNAEEEAEKDFQAGESSGPIDVDEALAWLDDSNEDKE